VTLVCAFCIYVRADNLLLFPGGSRPTSIDLSKATRLKDVTFQVDTWSVEWVATALQTITPEHRDLQHIKIGVSRYLTVRSLGIGPDIRQGIGEANYGEWLDLDRLLVQFWESHLIRPMVQSWGLGGVRYNIRDLLPEIVKGGIIRLGLCM
jgi:hypothetical protein